MKLDYTKELKHLYGPPAREVVAVDVPPMTYLMIDGQGDPNGSAAFQEAVEALFSAAYAIKFAVKKAGGLDYGVLPLEGLWWAEDPSAFVSGDKAGWQWTLMIMQPATEALIAKALAEVRAKKDLPALARLRVECLDEGRCAQVLHLGPFSEEGPTIQRLHQFIGGPGRFRGRHHEIYLSDLRRAAPEKWRTVLRQPMA